MPQSCNEQKEGERSFGHCNSLVHKRPNDIAFSGERKRVRCNAGLCGDWHALRPVKNRSKEIERIDADKSAVDTGGDGLDGRFEVS